MVIPPFSWIRCHLNIITLDYDSAPQTKLYIILDLESIQSLICFIMKRFFLFLNFLLFVYCLSAQDFDGYNCVYLDSKTNNAHGVDEIIEKSLTKYGFNVVKKAEEIPSERTRRMATLILTYNFELRAGQASSFRIKLVNMLNETILESEGLANSFLSSKRDMTRSCEKALKKITSQPYKFDSSKTPRLSSPLSSYSNYSEDQFKKEIEREIDVDPIVGIYKNIGDDFYKLVIVKENDKFFAIVLDTEVKTMFKGDVKAVFEILRGKYYNTVYYKNDYSKIECVSEYNSDDYILKIGNFQFMKIFPN